jgi:hypothetical protein
MAEDRELEQFQGELREAIAGFRAWSRNTLRHRAIIAKGQRIIGSLEERIGDELARGGGVMTLEEIRTRLLEGRAVDRRSAEWAARHWSVFNGPELVVLLEKHDEVIGAFRRNVFRVIDSWRSVDDASKLSIEAVVGRAEQGALGAHCGRSFTSWLSDEGIREVGRAASIHPEPFFDGLVEQGLELDWQLTARVRDFALAALLKRKTIPQCIETVRTLPDQALDRLLPPREAGSRRDRFFSNDQYPHIIGRWLNASCGREHEAPPIDDLLLEVLGDPTNADLAYMTRWRAVESAAPTGYAALAQRITKADIEFFFEKLPGDAVRDRGRFWLRYLPTIRQTKVYLRGHDRDLLYPIVSRSNRALDRTLLRRAGKMSSTITSAFVLWFDHVAVVEFANSGHASYVWRRAALEKLGYGPRKQNVHSPNDLKDPQQSQGGTQLEHRGHWQGVFAAQLRAHGIEPSR